MLGQLALSLYGFVTKANPSLAMAPLSRDCQVVMLAGAHSCPLRHLAKRSQRRLFRPGFRNLLRTRAPPLSRPKTLVSRRSAGTLTATPSAPAGQCPPARHRAADRHQPASATAITGPSCSPGQPYAAAPCRSAACRAISGCSSVMRWRSSARIAFFVDSESVESVTFCNLLRARKQDAPRH